MIKTIQYLAEAGTSRVLVALDLKAAFQNVSRRIEQTDSSSSGRFDLTSHGLYCSHFFACTHRSTLQHLPFRCVSSLLSLFSD